MHSCSDCKKVFNDYLAMSLIGEKQVEYLKHIVFEWFAKNTTKNKDLCILKWFNKYFLPIILSRSVFTEEKLNLFSQKHKKCQYVILGAGFDTFSFRNSNENINIFEIDHPSTQIYKKRRIETLNWKIPQNVHFISVDFEKEKLDKILNNDNFDKNLPTFFSILGISYYISYEILKNLIKTISSITNNEIEIVIDIPDENTYTGKENSRAKDLAFITNILGEPMKQGFSYDTIQSLFEEFNIEIEEYLTANEIQKKYLDKDNFEQIAYENVFFVSGKKQYR
jgi:methyltransferase (TIGR00027 family)